MIYKECIDSSFLIQYPDWVLYAINSLYLILCTFIIFKMCKLCTKAFSYTNFHIHEAYKLYSLALLTIFLIIINRVTQIQFFNEEKSKFLEGWVILDEVIGIISVFSMNQLHLLSALTWLMVANRCDFSNQYSTDHLEVDDPQKRFTLHQRIMMLRKIFLYYFIPITLLISVYGSLGAFCKVSRMIIVLVCTVVFFFVAFTFMKLLIQRWNSKHTPLKVKLIWGYMILMISARQIFIWLQFLEDMVRPISKMHLFGAQKWQIVYLFCYVIFITILPVLLLSYLAQKQLSKQKQQIEKRSQIFQYKNTFI